MLPEGDCPLPGQPKGKQGRGIVINQTVNHIQMNAMGGAQTVLVSSSTGSPCSENRSNRPPPLPGWPPTWPTPEILPLPFSPPMFTLSLDQLQTAVASCPPDTLEACRQGNPEATAAFMIELIRQIHSRTEERNIYLNPRRADQALVYVPECWETRALEAANREVFGRIANELGELTDSAKLDPAVLAVATAARTVVHKKCDQLADRSRRPMTAHLESLRQQTLYGSEKIGERGSHFSITLRCFGTEVHGHLQPNSVAFELEDRLRVYETSQVTPESANNFITQALVSYAEILTRNHPENLTVLSGVDGVYVNNRRSGWELQPADETANKLATRVSEMLIHKLDRADKGFPAKALVPYLREMKTVDTDCRLRVLNKFTSAAHVYYSGLSPFPNSAQDRQHMARSIIAQTGTRALPIPNHASDSRIVPSNLHHEPMTDFELEELLGYAP